MSSGNSLSSSPARSSISTVAIVGANANATSSSTMGLDEYHFPADLISIQDRKDEAVAELKSDLMAALNKEVKSLDEDSWMFDGPRSRINLISRPGGSVHRRIGFPMHKDVPLPK